MTKRSFGTRRKHRNYKKKTLRNKKFRGAGNASGKNKNSENGNDCPICFMPLSDSPTITTPCNHTFHRTCLRTNCNSTVANRYNCPICRANIRGTCNTLNQPNQSLFSQFLGSSSSSAPIPVQQAILPPPPPMQTPVQIPGQPRTYPFDYMYDLNAEVWEPVFYEKWRRLDNTPKPNVRTLDLSEIEDINFDDDRGTIELDIEGICNNFPNLETLKLNDNNLTSIPACIGNLRNLNFLFLNNNNIPPAQVISIFADPYWNNKRVHLTADNLPVINNGLPYDFVINSRINARSNRSRIVPQNAGRKRRKRSTRRRK